MVRVDRADEQGAAHRRTVTQTENAQRDGAADRPGLDTREGGATLRTGVGEALKVARGHTATHEHLRNRLLTLFLATLIVDVVASALILSFERHEPGTGITNIGDSLFWTSTQLLTVSSQLPNPLSTPARVLDVLLQGWAISVVAMLAGAFGAFFHRRGMERDPIHGSPQIALDFVRAAITSSRGGDLASAGLCR